MTESNNVLINIIRIAGMYITGVCTVTNITISPAVVLKGAQFSIQCTYDVSIYYLVIRRADPGGRLWDGIKAAEYYLNTGQSAVHRTLRDRATFYPRNKTLVIRNAKYSEDAAWYRCEVTATYDASGKRYYSDAISLLVYGKAFVFEFRLCSLSWPESWIISICTNQLIMVVLIGVRCETTNFYFFYF